MDEKVYLNGTIVPHSRARVSVSDHGFLYGYGLFETMRAYNGKIFLLERHLKRLMSGAEAIGLGKRLANIDLEKACRDTLKANDFTEARVRLTVTGGEGDAFPWEGKSGTPTVVVTARPYHPLPGAKYERGMKAGIASVRRCAQSTIAGIKSVNYLVSVLARMEAARYGLDESLLLNDRGFIAECGNSNVFFVEGDNLITPSLDSGILPGITREVVMELAAEMGISVTEAEISLSELKHFNEAFLTSSIIEVMPLVAVRGEGGRMISIGAGRPGEVTRRLMGEYREKVERETYTHPRDSLLHSE
jgi:branched-chain amino acid aminotransferase